MGSMQPSSEYMKSEEFQRWRNGKPCSYCGKDHTRASCPELNAILEKDVEEIADAFMAGDVSLRDLD